MYKNLNLFKTILTIIIERPFNIPSNMKTLVTFAFILNFAQGFEILTATLDPPTNPILEGTDVTAKV